MIMPTPKPMWVYVVRKYNFETGKHEIVQTFETKEEAHKETHKLRNDVKESKQPFNYTYEKVEKGRPDLHHERLKEEWGYKRDIKN